VRDPGGRVGVGLSACIVEWKNPIHQYRFLDRRRVASDLPAMFLKSSDLAAEDIWRAERIPHLRMPRYDPECNILAAGTDQDWGMGFLDWLGVEARILQLEMSAVETRPLLRSELERHFSIEAIASTTELTTRLKARKINTIPIATSSALLLSINLSFHECCAAHRSTLKSEGNLLCR
jgi:hypothetical protein